MGNKIKNILVINQPLGNRGDESAHRALMRGLNRKFPDTKITVLVPFDLDGKLPAIKELHANNTYVEIHHPHNYRMVVLMQMLLTLHITKLGTVLHPFLRKFIPYYKQADWVICAPGGICMGGFQNWLHLYMLYLAKLYRKKLVYYSRSFGPFPTVTCSNRVFKNYSIKMLRYFDFLSIRDTKTMRLADDFGVTYIPSADTAFLDTPQVEVPVEVTERIGHDYMVFVPNKLTWHYVYKTIPQTRIDMFYLKIIEQVSGKYPELKIVMLPQLYGYDLEHGDYAYFLKLKETSPLKDRIVVLEDVYGSDIQQCIIRNARFVIGARYHSIVFAVNNSVPFISLSYEHKMSGLLEMLDLQQQEVDIVNVIDSEELCDKAVGEVEKMLSTCEGADIVTAQKQAKAIVEDCLNRLCYKFI